MSLTLVLGGARSGKSTYAERLALSRSDSPIYLATSRPWDDDHRARIARHIRDRGPEWSTFEEEKVLSRLKVSGRVVVMDCATLYLTNYFIDCSQDSSLALAGAKEEFDRAVDDKNDWIIVSNELGQGLHAPTESGRRFTDIQGFFNQHVARRAQRVVLMVAGIPLTVKDENEDQ